MTASGHSICYFGHCWGKVKFLTLTKDNLHQWTSAIPVRQISQVFQDAMRVTLEIGLSYTSGLTPYASYRILTTWKTGEGRPEEATAGFSPR